MNDNALPDDIAFYNIQMIVCDIAEPCITKALSDYKRHPEWNKLHHAKLRTHLHESFVRAIESSVSKLLSAAKTLGSGSVRKRVAAERKKTEIARERARTKLALELKASRSKLLRYRKQLATIEAEIRASTARLNSVISAENDLFFEYPAPPLPSVPPTPDGTGLPTSSGIYFAWNKGVVTYIGRANDLAARCKLGAHHALQPDDMLSFVLMDSYYLTWAECFYIGRLRPSRNFGRSATHNKNPRPENILKLEYLSES